MFKKINIIFNICKKAPFSWVVVVSKRVAYLHELCPRRKPAKKFLVVFSIRTDSYSACKTYGIEFQKKLYAASQGN